METGDRMMDSHTTQLHVNGAVLKNIAYVTMFIDHFFAVIMQEYLWRTAVDGVWDPQLTVLYRAGRAVGRIAFILFAHQIVEGFLHTRSRGKFLMRLGLFALVSEMPFDLAFSGTIIDWNSQNVFCTLFIGVLVLTVGDALARFQGVIYDAGRFLALLLGCLAAYWGNTDYRYMGVLLIFTFYKAHDRCLADKIMFVGSVMLLGTWSANCLRYLKRGYTVLELFLVSMREMYGVVAFLPIAFYDGKRGRQLPKWFCYGFYPLHLLFLYGAALYVYDR